MRSFLTLIAVLCAAWLAAACDTGGDTAEGRQAQGDGGCAALCASVARAECEAADEAGCMADCEASAALAEASESEACREAWSGYAACMADASLACSGSDVSRLPCRAAYDRADNYCVHGFTPEEPCLDNPVANDLCGGSTPNAKICRGDEERGCVVGGTAYHSDFYCCP